MKSTGIKNVVGCVMMWALVGCGAYHCDYYGGSINYCNDGNEKIGVGVPAQVQGDQKLVNAVEQTQNFVQICLSEELDLSTITFETVDAQSKVLKDCGGPDSAAVGCTEVSDKETTTFLAPFSDTPTEVEIIAHEIGHWYYFTTTGDSDHTHQHNEWFGRLALTRDDPTAYGGLTKDGSIADCALYRAQE